MEWVIFFWILIPAVLSQTGDCPDPPAVGNGFVISSGPYFNNTFASYTCQNGYSMSGRAYVRCAAAVWKGNTPTCNIVSNIQTTVNNGDDWVVAKWVLVGLAGLMGFLLILLLIGACYYFCCRRNPERGTRVKPLDNNGYRIVHVNETKTPPQDKTEPPPKKINNVVEAKKKKKNVTRPSYRTTAPISSGIPYAGFGASIGTKESQRQQIINSPPSTPQSMTIDRKNTNETPLNVSTLVQTDAPSFIAKTKLQEIQEHVEPEPVTWTIPMDHKKDHVADLLQDPPDAMSPVGSQASYYAPRSYSPNIPTLNNKTNDTKSMWKRAVESEKVKATKVWMPHANPMRMINTSTR